MELNEILSSIKKQEDLGLIPTQAREAFAKLSSPLFVTKALQA